MSAHTIPNFPLCAPMKATKNCMRRHAALCQPKLGTETGQVEKQDYEYERNGTANMFMSVEPLVGKRHVRVTDRRTKQDFAELLRCLSDEDYPEADSIVLVTDNLNTHSPACLYERFEPAEARRLAEHFEWHYTPEHGSWLNMAEIELSVLSRQCLARRIPDKETLIAELSAWEKSRNNVKVQIDWQLKQKMLA